MRRTPFVPQSGGPRTGQLSAVTLTLVAVGALAASSVSAQSLDGFDEPFPPLDGDFIEPISAPSQIPQRPLPPGAQALSAPGFVEPISIVPQQPLPPRMVSSGPEMMSSDAMSMSSGGMSGSQMRRGPSQADQQAFAQVYDFLAERYMQAQQTGMLYNNADAIIQQPAPIEQPSAIDPSLLQGGTLNNLGGPDPDLGLGGLPPLDDLSELPEPDFLSEEPANEGGFLRNIYLGGYVGGTFPQGGSVTDESGTSNTAELKGKFSYGGGGLIGLQFGPARLELEGQYAQSEYEVESGGTGIFNGETSVSSTRIAGFGNALFGLNLFGDFNAMLGGSVGYGQQTDTVGGSDYRARGLMYGPLVGLSYTVADRFELGARYRYLLGSDFEFKNTTTDATAYSRSVNEHQGMLTATFRF